MNVLPKFDPRDYIVLGHLPPGVTGPDPPYILHGLEERVVDQILADYARYQAEVAKLNTQILAARERFQLKIPDALAAPRARAHGD